MKTRIKNLIMRKYLYGWYIVLINALMGCTMAAHFSQYSMTVIELSQQMNVSIELLLFGDTVKSIAIVIGMMISGIIYNAIEFKKTFILSLIAMIIPQMIFPFVQNILVLYTLKIIQGLSAIIFPVFLIIIIQWSNDKQKGLATALFNGIFFGGGGLGALMTGSVIERIGWKGSYFLLAFISLIIGAIWLLTVKDNTKYSQIKSADDFDKKPSKKHDTNIGKSLDTWLLIAIFVAYTWVLQVISVDVPIFGNFLGFNPKEIGSVMSLTSIGILLSALLSGFLSDSLALKSKNPTRVRITVISVGALLIIVSSALLMTLEIRTYWMFYTVVLLFSLGGGWGLGVFWSIVAEIYSGEKFSMATGMIGGASDLSMPIAPFVVGVIFGAKGLWNIGWGSCLVVGVISGVSGLILIFRSSGQQYYSKDVIEESFLKETG